MKEQTITNSIFIVVQLDWHINNARYLMTIHIGIEYVCKQFAPKLIDWHVFVITVLIP
jgi:hypothetical protein